MIMSPEQRRRQHTPQRREQVDETACTMHSGRKTEKVGQKSLF